MTVNLTKNYFQFAHGYKENFSNGTCHQTKTCFSFMNRYKNQTSTISQMMKNNRSGALRVFNIGIAEGQEPLTHITSAYNLIKGTDRSISNVLDLTMTDILKETPISPRVVKKAEPEAVEYLKTLYRNPERTHFETPFEDIVQKMLQQGKRQDVVLFNNVIQHVNFKDEKATYASIGDLIKLVEKDGIFCFTCDVLHHQNIKEHFDTVIEMLKQAGFTEIEKGIFKKIK